MVCPDHGYSKGEAGVRRKRTCGYYECEAGGSHAGGYDRPTAGVFLRVSHYQKQLDLHSTGWDGAV